MLTSAEREAKLAEFRRRLRDEALAVVREDGSTDEDLARARAALNALDFTFDPTVFAGYEVASAEEAHLLLDALEEFFDYMARFGEH